MKANLIGLGIVGLVVVVLASSGQFLWTDTPWRVDPNKTAYLRMVHLIRQGDMETISTYLISDPALARLIYNGESLLHIAARFNRADIIEALLEKGIDINTRGQWNGTALHWACWWGSVQAAELLVDKGLDIEDKKDRFGSSPLLWAAHGSRNVPTSTGDYVATVEMLIGKGAQADTYNSQGVPAVMMASDPVAEVLLKHGAKRPETTRQDDSTI